MLDSVQKRQKMESSNYAIQNVSREEATVFKKLRPTKRDHQNRTFKKKLHDRNSTSSEPLFNHFVETNVLADTTNFTIEIDDELGNNLSLFDKNF